LTIPNDVPFILLFLVGEQILLENDTTLHMKNPNTMVYNWIIAVPEKDLASEFNLMVQDNVRMVTTLSNIFSFL
jgi:diadenosine tetraphosphate (Ap4A) HIT family hydrolase